MKGILILTVLVSIVITPSFSYVYAQEFTESQRIENIEKQIKDLELLIKEGNTNNIFIGIVVAFSIGGFFSIIEMVRRYIRGKDYREKRIACIKELINAHIIFEQGYRSAFWLQLDTGMSDEQFYKFYSEFNMKEDFLKSEKKGKAIIKIKDDRVEKFEKKLKKAGLIKIKTEIEINNKIEEKELWNLPKKIVE